MKSFYRISLFVLIAVAALPFFVHAAPELNSILDEVKSKYVFNGAINAAVTDGDTLYLGGSFTQAWEEIGEAGLFDLTGGDFVDGFPKVETLLGGHDTVYSSISDGNGGWYIGGSFDTVNDDAHYSLIHVLSDNTIDTDFDPEFTPDSDFIYALELSSDGSILYVGGSFNSVNETTRHNLAAVNTLDGSLVSGFDPNVSDAGVSALMLSSDDSTLYVGGSFTCVNGNYGDLDGCLGVTRNYLAAFNTTDGVVTDFEPTVGGSVESLVLSSNDATLYVGTTITEDGSLFAYNTIDGSYDASFGTDDDVVADGDVYSLALSADDTTLFAGGSFETIAGAVTRNGLASFTTSDGAVTAFDPDVNDAVNGLALSSDELTLYAGGSFTSVNNKTDRPYLAAFDTTTGTATSEDFAGSVSAGVNTIALSGTDLFFGGESMNINTVSRGEVAAIDLTTYELTDFNPDIQSGDLSVYALALSPDASTLYIGGDFHGINGVGNVRSNIAAVTTADGIMTAFDPDVNGVVNALDVSSDGLTVYAGGNITCVNGDFDYDEEICFGVERTYAASFSSVDGTVSAFAPSLITTVDALMLSADDSRVYLGGSFTERILSVDATDGSDPLSTEPVANGTVYALELSSDGSTLYVGGGFSEFVADQIAVGEGALFNATTGVLVDSQSILSTNASTVYASIPDGSGGWYVGGSFNRINGAVWDSRIVHILSDMTVDPAFEPDFGFEGGTVRALALSSDGETLYAGGGFTTIDATTRNHIAAFNTNDGSLTAFDPNTNGDVYALQLSSDDGTLYAAGSFLIVNGATGRGDVAAFTTADGIATDFAPSLNNGATSLALSSDDLTLYVGGNFTCVEYDSGLEVCNADRNYLAALDTTATTSVATAFNPDMSDAVYSLALTSDDEILYAGGDFFTVGGEARQSLAAIDTSDSLAMPFAPNPDSTIYALHLSADDSVLYAGGDFSSMSGVEIAGLAAINTGDATLTDFDALLSADAVYTIGGPVDGNIFVGGTSMTTVDRDAGGGARNGLAALSVSDFELLDFNPDFTEVGNPVRSLALTPDDEILYVGGAFSSGGGTPREYLAAIQTSDASVLDFDPADDSSVRALALHPDGDELYVGGASGWFGIYDSEAVVVEEEEEEESNGGRGGGTHRKPISNPPTFREDTNLLETLRSLIQQFIAQGGTPSPAMLAFLGTSPTTSGEYTRDLGLNAEGPDVTQLQLFLIAQNKGPQAQALAVVGATGFFGPLTQAALAEFQASVGIVPAVGYFGPVTRAHVNGL